MNHTFPTLASLLGGESLEQEYKEDLDDRNKQGPYPDDKLAEALMAISNANGGCLLLGVREAGDKTGVVTGINPNRTDTPTRLRNKIAGKFAREPQLACHEYADANGRVFAFYIAPAEPPPHQLQTGVFKIRKERGGKQGPENVPFLLTEVSQWEALRGVHQDFSSRLNPDLPVAQAADLFSPLAVGLFQTRLREGRINNPNLRTIPNFEQQLEALGLTGTVGGHKVLTNAALILFGSNDLLKERIPNHRAQFQAFGQDGTVVHNLFTDKPGLENRSLLSLATRLDELFRSVIQRKELKDGLFRIDIPDYGDDAVREAALNAFIHRDYTQSEEVIIQINQRQFLVTNPGGFYRDVTPQNILFHEPCPRNRCLAQACADLGLVEKSGRGVDRIFWDQIRFMRPLPSYAESTSNTVRLSLLGGSGSLEAIKWMYEHLAGQEDLMIRVVHGGLIHVLLAEGQATREEMIAALPGLPERDGRRAITELVDAGVFTRIGHGKGQRIVLSEKLQTALGKPEAFHHQSGSGEEMQRQALLNYVREHGSVTRSEAAKRLNLPSDVNLYRRLIKPLVDTEKLKPEGTGNRTRYVIANVQHTVQHPHEGPDEMT